MSLLEEKRFKDINVFDDEMILDAERNKTIFIENSVLESGFLIMKNCNPDAVIFNNCIFDVSPSVLHLEDSNFLRDNLNLQFYNCVFNSLMIIEYRVEGKWRLKDNNDIK